MVFYSRYADYQVLVRPEKKVYVEGTEVDRIKPLTANFGVHMVEQSWTEGEGADGLLHTNIRGNYCDTDQQADEKGWTDEEKSIVETVLLRMCEQQGTREDIKLYSAPKAAPPWKNYDSTHHFRIPALAGELGVVAEALAYEQQEKKREGVVKALREKLEETPVAPAEEKVEELVAQ